MYSFTNIFQGFVNKAAFSEYLITSAKFRSMQELSTTQVRWMTARLIVTLSNPMYSVGGMFFVHSPHLFS